MKSLKLPDSPSVAKPDAQGRLCAPSAERNKDAIAEVLGNVLPETGGVLEIASGTGQHIVHFAECFPNLNWLPTDMEPERLKSIQAYKDHAALPNLYDPMPLDASHADWPVHNCDAILVVNLFHLISEDSARAILRNISNALAPHAPLIIYGPFMRAGELTSEGDEAFHHSLVKQDPSIGYKDDFDMAEWLMDVWLEPETFLDMPSNNLCIIARKS